MNANLATLIETPGVLDAGAFAIVFGGAETLLVFVERPCEDQHHQTRKHSCGDQHELNGSSHVLPLDVIPAPADPSTILPRLGTRKGRARDDALHVLLDER